MPTILKTVILLNTGEFIGESVGIAGCLLYLNAMTSQTNAFKIYRNISIGVIATFALISLLLILASFISDDNDNNKAFAVAKSNATMILFQAFGLLSLVAVGVYIRFLYHNPAAKFHVASSIENSLYFKVIILGIALYGLFNALSIFYHHYTTFEGSDYKYNCPALMKYSLFFSVVLFLGSLAVSGLFYFHLVSNYVFFGAIAGICMGMGLLSLIATSSYFKNLSKLFCNIEIIDLDKTPDFNEYESGKSESSESDEGFESEKVSNQCMPQLVGVRANLIKSGLMNFISFSLLSTGTGLMMTKSNTCHIISIGLLFAGFILQLSSTAFGKQAHYNESKNCLFYEKLFHVNEFFKKLATPKPKVEKKNT